MVDLFLDENDEKWFQLGKERKEKKEEESN